jgi:hypothetical protein
VFGELADDYEQRERPPSPATPKTARPSTANLQAAEEDDSREQLLKENEELKKKLDEAHVKQQFAKAPENDSNGDLRQMSLKSFTKLEILIYEAEGLPKKDLFSKGEPYCKGKKYDSTFRNI